MIDLLRIGAFGFLRRESTKSVSVPHFARDYRLYVSNLFRSHSPDEAAALSVGGASDFDEVGRQEADILAAIGLGPEHVILDLGCGSGRLARVLGARLPGLDYLGTDVASELLTYAKKHAPSTFKFQLHIDLNFPVEASSVDFVVSFSVFTHLYHEETFAYLRDAVRILKPNGRIVFSFLEFSRHWSVFEAMLSPDWQLNKPHLNMFIERSAIRVWADKLGLNLLGFDIAPTFGQSVAVLIKDR